tara:strand:+ start:143 stop:457 length:315 start_codon:yes stop_codon:yes gene_type:complete
MLRNCCLLTIITFFLLTNITWSEKINSNKDCSWDNELPCIEIKSGLFNSSKLSQNSIKKTVITRRDILESGAVDIIDVLENLPNIDITQSGPKGQQASLFMRGT